MKKPPKQTRSFVEILSESLTEFDRTYSATYHSRQLSLYERRMTNIYGAQYEGRLGEQFENKPKPEVNKIKRSIKRILSELRNNPITVDYVAKDGSDKDELAEACDDLYRSDEQDSVGEEAYDLSDQEAVTGGFGAYLFAAKLEDEYDEWNDQQRICIELIPEADQCVYFDLNAKRYDKADARFCWVLTAMTRDAYREEWGDDPTSWPKPDNDHYEFEWDTVDVIYVARYYKVEEVSEMVQIWEAPDGEEARYSESDFEKDDQLEAILLAGGWRLVDDRKVKRRGVHKYIMSGGKILEDCGFIAGSHIPVIPQYGERIFTDGVEIFSGHVRAARDPQQLYNAIMSMLMDLATTGMKEKPIFAPEQIDDFRAEWDKDNIDNYSVLRAHPLKDAEGNPIQTGPLGYTKAPEIPPALSVLIGIVNQDLNDILGEQPQAEKMVSNVSGKLAEMVQSYKDLPSFIYSSNRAKTRRRGGVVWLSMAKDIYVEIGRKMKAINREGQPRQVVLNEPALDDGGNYYERNNFAEASFDVYSDVGPSTASKREKILRDIQGFLQYTQNDPEIMRILTLFAMKNFEGKEVGMVRDWADRKFMEMGGREPTPEEAAEIEQTQANAQPDANEQFLQASAREADAKAQKTEADTLKTLADVEETEAKTLETYAGINRDDLSQAVAAEEANRRMNQPVSAPPQRTGEQ
jgi:hypothetical protein